MDIIDPCRSFLPYVEEEEVRHTGRRPDHAGPFELDQVAASPIRSPVPLHPSVPQKELPRPPSGTLTWARFATSSGDMEGKGRLPTIVVHAAGNTPRFRTGRNVVGNRRAGWV